MIVPIELRLAYTHGFGELSPYFAGLERGAAVATRCDACGRTWFAPRLQCRCGGASLRWIELPGRGVIAALTRGRATLPCTDIAGDFTFGLIRLDGADNLCFGRLGAGSEHVRPGDAVRLRRAEGAFAHPAQRAEWVSSNGD
jgi:uncharacterized OB-fold protein